ncbi:calcyclin-binding protein [Chelonus insularis]|uniref:calcyclin-binding protein n=1 Tax=Chelonus insularis TaxID=460826 RepID=UPI00158AFAAF|nr:calcyclin-binding protein [Chelonus insularis]
MSTRQKEIELDIKELNSFIHQAHRQKTKDILSLELRRLQTELSKLIETNLNNENESLRSISNTHTSSESKCYDIKLTNYCWDQSDKFMKLYITLKNVQTLPQEAVTCNFTERSMNLRVLGLDNKNYQLSISNLCEDIDPNKSYTKIKTDMIVVFLNKKLPKNWSHVTGIEKRIKEAKNTTPDFESSDPEAGLMNLMKKMYQEGDDDMKRTIAQAWTESQEKRSSKSE